MLYDKVNENIVNLNKNTDLIYTIYTSGSTGKPKGVLVEHRQVNNFIVGMNKDIDFSGCKKILNVTTMCFDIFVLESLLPLTKGLEVVIAEEDVIKDPDMLNNIILKHKIDIMQNTPSRLKLLMSTNNYDLSFKVLKILLVGGEEFPRNVIDKLQKYKNMKLYNMYGPTETTVWSTVKNLSNDYEVSIGKPIANTEVYILGSKNELIPIGGVGELCIGGDGVSRGYLNREDLYREKFIKNPFDSKKIIYKTGDFARWKHNGEIEYLTRIDNMVKIRGHRIELAEIENQLLKYKSIKEAVVLVKEEDGKDKYLCGYLVSEQQISVEDLRKYLA